MIYVCVCVYIQLKNRSVPGYNIEVNIAFLICFGNNFAINKKKITDFYTP